MVLAEIIRFSSVETNDVNFIDSFWRDEKYRKSSWIAIALVTSV